MLEKALDFQWVFVYICLLFALFSTKDAKFGSNCFNIAYLIEATLKLKETVNVLSWLES